MVMKVSHKAIVRLLTHPKLLRTRTNILLFSHMRANTSLLGHILGSHPEIEGYYEMHLSYKGPRSLLGLKISYLRDNAPKAGSHIFFDKLLHNNCEVDAEILRRRATRSIFMLRNPERTIKSVVALFRRKRGHHIFAEPEAATAYYVERIRKLVELSKKVEKDYYYLDAESITENTAECLASLERWLSLNSSLSSEYDLFTKTGQERAGDSSEYIVTGQIANGMQDYSHICVPPELIQEAQHTYEHCRTLLISRSHTSFTSPHASR